MAKIRLVGSNSGIRSPQFHKKKERERKIKMYLLGVAGALVIISPIITIRSSKLQVTTVALSGNEVTKSDDIQRIVEDDLKGNYFLFIPKSSAFFYPKSKIVADVLAAAPRIEDIHAGLTSVHTISITIRERQPEALYCDPTCYFIDDTGYIYSKAPDFSDNVYTTFTTLPKLETPLGQSLLPTLEYVNIETFIKDISLLKLEPKSFDIESATYTLTLAAGTTIMWRRDADLGQILSNLTSFMNDSSILTGGHSFSDLRYIDLRVGNKVFYKFKDEL